MHMVRNAVDHGIEQGAARTAQGKTATGTVKLEAFHAGDNVVIQLTDDGAGMDLDAIRAKAVELSGEEKHLVDFLRNGGTARDLARYIAENDPQNAHRHLTDEQLVLESIRSSMPGARWGWSRRTCW
jgi:hypothetical protein